MEKLFTVAGTSNLNGVVKFRFANDLKSRVKVLERNGHTEINLIELPAEMTKEAAIAYLETLVAPADTTEQQIADMEAEGGATAQSIRADMDADGYDTAGMSGYFPNGEVAARENAEAA